VCRGARRFTLECGRQHLRHQQRDRAADLGATDRPGHVRGLQRPALARLSLWATELPYCAAAVIDATVAGLRLARHDAAGEPGTRVGRMALRSARAAGCGDRPQPGGLSRTLRRAQRPSQCGVATGADRVAATTRKKEKNGTAGAALEQPAARCGRRVGAIVEISTMASSAR